MRPLLLALTASLLAGCWPLIPGPYGGSDDTGVTDTDDTDAASDRCEGLGGVTLGLDVSSNFSEGESWSEDGVALTVYELNGTFSAQGDGDCVWIAPALLEADLRDLDCTVQRVEYELIDWCGPGCVEATAYAGGGEVASATNSSSTGTTTTLTVEADEPIDLVTVTGFEDQICGIGLY